MENFISGVFALFGHVPKTVGSFEDLFVSTGDYYVAIEFIQMGMGRNQPVYPLWYGLR